MRLVSVAAPLPFLGCPLALALQVVLTTQQRSLTSCLRSQGWQDQQGQLVLASDLMLLPLASPLLSPPGLPLVLLRRMALLLCLRRDMPLRRGLRRGLLLRQQLQDQLLVLQGLWHPQLA